MAPSPFDLNLRHLRAVLAIHEHGSITAAAEIVFLSQPAMTQAVAKLERQLGVDLFERQTAGMRATPAGEMVAGRVKSVLEHLKVSSRGLTRGEHAARMMTMTQLRAFLALSEAGTYGAAAAMTGLSQTAVHRAVSDLEQLLGKALVERRGRRVYLNPTGKRLARGSRLAINEINAIISELGLEAGGSVISIGALPLSRPFLLPEALSLMTAERPDVRVRIFEGSWRELVEPLRDGVLDLIVGALRPHDINDLRQYPLAEDRLIIVAGRNHPLAGKAMPDWETLASYPWIVAPENSPLRVQWERQFEGRSLPDCPIECGSVMIIGRMLTTSRDFLTLLSPDQVALQIRSGLLAQVGEPLATTLRVIGITTRLNWQPTRLQKRFMEILDEVARTRNEAAQERKPIADWV